MINISRPSVFHQQALSNPFLNCGEGKSWRLELANHTRMLHVWYIVWYIYLHVSVIIGVTKCWWIFHTSGIWNICRPGIAPKPFGIPTCPTRKIARKIDIHPLIILHSRGKWCINDKHGDLIFQSRVFPVGIGDLNPWWNLWDNPIWKL